MAQQVEQEKKEMLQKKIHDICLSGPEKNGNIGTVAVNSNSEDEEYLEFERRIGKSVDNGVGNTQQVVDEAKKEHQELIATLQANHIESMASLDRLNRNIERLLEEISNK